MNIHIILLVNIVLFKWLFVYHSLERHLGCINDIGSAMENDVTDDTPHCNTLLNTMTAESIGKK